MALRQARPQAEGWMRADMWQPIATAPKDGTHILAIMKNPIPRPNRDDLRLWDGLQVVVRHPGLCEGFDIGWNVAAPVGHGGFPDDWFDGWMPLSAPPLGGIAAEIDAAIANCD